MGAASSATRARADCRPAPRQPARQTSGFRSHFTSAARVFLFRHYRGKRPAWKDFPAQLTAINPVQSGVTRCRRFNLRGNTSMMAPPRHENRYCASHLEGARHMAKKKVNPAFTASRRSSAPARFPGRPRQKRGRDRSQVAARSACRRSQQARHEDRRRQGRRLPRAGFAVVQVRRLIIRRCRNGRVSAQPPRAAAVIAAPPGRQYHLPCPSRSCARVTRRLA